MPFDEIQQAVLDGKAEAGLLIHEGQLTYQDEGLRKIVDLGEWWADRTGGLPLPLGGNVIKRDLGVKEDLIYERLSRKVWPWSWEGFENRYVIHFHDVALRHDILPLPDLSGRDVSNTANRVARRLRD